MPRGRHRNPEPLHRLLTPTAVAGVSVAGAGAAWLLAEPMALRLLVAVTAAAGLVGAVVMRSWDLSAGRRVTELGRERVKDEWRTDERIAELESDLEEARVLRGKLDAKLRSKRVELAGLRGEHASLLRRYATAETERASALERRRLLAIEAAAAAAPPAVPKELPAVTEERTSAGAATTVGFARAHAALAALAHKAAPAAAKTPAAIAPAKPANQAKPSAPAKPAALEAHSRPALTGPVPAGPVPAGPAAAVPARRLAAAVAPYAAQRRPTSRVEGGFDFFGTKTAAQARAVIESVQNEDLADVVGAEALAVHKAESAQGGADPEFKAATEEHRAVGQVIDLTAHDETEPIDVVQLRTAIS
ncbi:hypothetical protein OTB20_12960 [Streptomyces sp. H27-H1]|uniref:hypothetical protein n=1 Tax=Streptomyces sp. H27-H1 TaxID=2996461 RepID=UPI00226FF0FA|nr:hypothetical protein [Streptomyces sp. H27-H1]MCY0927097.1 hypothetical protein [Streptomyces sp. H27-H1]